MRMLMRVTMQVEQANKAFKDGTLQKTMQSSLEALKPEAAYFGAIDGARTGLIFFDLKDVSDLPRIAEPFFHNFNATVEFCPVMNGDDLRAGMGKVQL
ncbi:MAG TPA: hypothetical protein VKV57_03500 [bacterium]|nr:hypothetical protein [bacterium]